MNQMEIQVITVMASYAMKTKPKQHKKAKGRYKPY